MAKTDMGAAKKDNTGEDALEDVTSGAAEALAGEPVGLDGTEEFSDIAEMSYEEARFELVEVVKGLENPEAPLEDTMRMWDRGEALAAHCQRILDAAQAKLEARQAG